jgi:hypothetical protein
MDGDDSKSFFREAFFFRDIWVTPSSSRKPADWSPGEPVYGDKIDLSV